jgi:ribosomal protein L20A (L18A)
MEEYTLVNQFTEIYRTGGRQKVKSREVQILKVEFDVQEEENVRGRNEKGTTVRDYR